MKHFKKTFYCQQIFCLLISLGIILLDQMTKYFAQHELILYVPIDINAVMNLTLAHNTGAAFSLFDSASGWQGLFFLCLNGSISLALLVWLFKLKYHDNSLKSWSLSLIIGGALGNIIDRVQLGYVIDFLDVHWGIHHWPIFNVADSAVCVGGFLLVWSMRKE